ncbi:MAG TPA: shikimate dehydrogenase [Gemmatimonadales bacterium]|nr:shikimate dehydrogenase [Gemmatimonadales bacterium]
MEIGAKTRLFAVIGDPVAHSLSPAMHNAAFRALGLDAVYVALRVPATALPAFLAAQAAIGGAGNVTVPHKEAVEGSVARKTDVCKRVGACNTYWTEDGGLVGDNTDVPGVIAALEQLGAGTHKRERWMLVGTGGSARAVAVAAADRGAELYVRSRDSARARTFAQWADSIGADASVAAGPVEVDIAINATPLGLAGHDPLPIDLNHIPGAQRALDLVYAAGETRWVHALRERGIKAADGREMLVQQGAAALERFFPGTTAPKEVMRAAVQRALRVQRGR